MAALRPVPRRPPAAGCVVGVRGEAASQRAAASRRPATGQTRPATGQTRPARRPSGQCRPARAVRYARAARVEAVPRSSQGPLVGRRSGRRCEPWPRHRGVPRRLPALQRARWLCPTHRSPRRRPHRTRNGRPPAPQAATIDPACVRRPRRRGLRLGDGQGPAVARSQGLGARPAAAVPAGAMPDPGRVRASTRPAPPTPRLGPSWPRRNRCPRPAQVPAVGPWGPRSVAGCPASAQ